MKKTLTRLFTVALLLMVSLGARAEVKVLFGVNGTELQPDKDGKVTLGQKELTGGTVIISQEDRKDGTTKLTLDVTPDKGYRLAVNGLEVYTVAPADISQTRTVKASAKLDIKSEDFTDEASKRTYTATIDSNLALWVKVAQFISESKADPTRSDDYSGTYYIGTAGYKEANTTTNYYLCPTEGWCYYQATDNFTGTDNGMPFLTTYQCRDGVYDVRKAIWVVDKYDSEYYTIKRAYDGKYIVFNGQIKTTSNSDRMRMHVEALSAVNDNALFKFVYNSTTKAYNIKPKNSADDRYWTTNGGNKPSLKGESGKTGGPSGFGNTAGIIGIYTISDNNNSYFLEEAIVPPTFTINSDGSVKLSSLEGTSIRYTTDGTTPTAESTAYTAAIRVTSTMTSIKAIAIRTSDNKASDAVTLPLHTYTYYIVNKSGDIAIKQVVKQAEGKALGSMAADIPADIRSPYLIGEAVTFYSFDEAFTSAEQLTDEVKISATPQDDANIYVTYTTDHLSEKFLKLRGARAFNIVTNGEYAYDNGGTLAYDNVEANKTQPSHLWNISGGDPYAVQIDNLGTGKFLVSSTMLTLSLAETATNNFILMEQSAAADEGSESVRLMKATGTEDLVETIAEFQASPVNITTKYNLIDKAGKLIQGNIESESSELGLPDEWRSPLVSEYHYYKTSGYDEATQTYTPTNAITSPFDADGGMIFVTYDVSDAVDLTGSKTYLLKFSGGEYFHQEDGHDGINKEGYTDYGVTSATKAIYPYNNGDFNLYVYGQEQWEAQLASGASTRSRWLWYIISSHNGNPLTGNDIDPYHVVIKSYQNHTVKDKIDKNDVNSGDKNYGPGSSYLQTYKPSDYASVITNIAYENENYSSAYNEKMPTSIVNGQPTEYMILGTSLQNMTLKTFNEVEGERRTVNSFEQYWKNNPTVKTLAGVANPAADNATLTEMGWHQFTSWAYSAPWDNSTKGLAKGTHWYQTISMGSGNFTVEEVSLTPQVILLDQHGWEIMRMPMYTDNNFTVVNTEGLSKYNSPMVSEYQWYPSAAKVTGYHKYNISDPAPEINIYENSANPANNNNVEWHIVGSESFTSNSLAVTPDRNLTGYSEQDKKYKTDFYVTYTVKSEYDDAYTGAATSDATIPSAYLLKQGGSYASTNGSVITTATAPASMEDIPNVMQWNLRPNFDIDREMGYKYAGETGAQDGAKSKEATDQDNYDEGRNGFDPYNVQIQSVASKFRYFTANTEGIALDGGAWKGTSTEVNLLNLSSKQTADGYDQTKLSITNATFMVVDDGAGNMRLMPRFDNSKVVTFSSSTSTPFKTLETQTTAATTGDKGTGTQTLWLELVPKATEVHFSSEMTDMNGHYLLAEDFTFDSESRGSEEHPFRGIIDGQLNTISGTTSVPLVAYADGGAIIRNVILEEVGISSATTFKVGTEDKTAIGGIVSVARGATRIYNCGILAKNSTVETDNKGYTKITSCSSSVGGTANYVGGLVGFLDDEARVINCFSYADVSGGDFAGGIVGYNNVATTSAANNLKTMVMNCMFYGEVSGESIAPIYNGEIISNAGDNGVGNYNYFRAEAAYIQDIKITKVYNCALSAETRYLQRFEFFRHLLNSHRELAAWWATGRYDNKNEMAKWVLEPSQIGTDTPYPILKSPGQYPSVVNYDAENAPTTSERNKGGKLGTLTVNIQIGAGGAVYGPPTGAKIETELLKLNITDKDPEHFNFNYYKVQLPYYNDVGTKNYTGNRVVTGWKIVSIKGGTPGTFSTSTADAPSFNFADRNCTNKDLYGTGGSNRIFNQGAYWDVPEGVTEITIEPYWAKCVYLADPNADKVYNTAMETGYDVPRVGGGQIYTNGNSYSIAGESQVVYTTMGNAIASSGTALFQGVDANSHSVYDYAVVLVGNYHHYYAKSAMEASKSKPYTITSIDLDGDNEPDYSYILRFNDRAETHPVRADFINIPGLGMAQKSTDSNGTSGTGSYNFGILIPKGWYESTNTSLLRFTQFEYEHSARSTTDAIIVQGGVMEQWVSNNQKGTSNKIPYIHVGGNVWFKEFHTGCHQDKQIATKHSPISVTGGDYDEFYLTGLYRGDVGNKEDNAECYINGGRFGTVCGAAMEGIGKANGANNTGNITWQIQNADIHEFYAGGLNAAKPVTGNLSTTIVDSHVDIFCGGPKFGDMSANKTVTTNATGCTFGTFFGAGYGGNSYSRYAPSNQNNVTNINWNNWVNQHYKQEYNATYGGVSTQFFYQFLPMSDNKTNVARILIDFVKFSLATTHGVTSTLTGCTINNNFYGGGSLGKVVGSVTSTLDGCIVKGNVFGAGFSASNPPVVVDAIGFETEPFYYTDLGNYRIGVKYESNGDYEPKTYTWQHKETVNDTNSAIDKRNKILYTTENLDKSNLGSVEGSVTLTIKGNSVIGTLEGEEGSQTLKEGSGNVFGGGESSYVVTNSNITDQKVTVNLEGETVVHGNVFGGGDKGEVQCSTEVNIRQTAPTTTDPEP